MKIKHYTMVELYNQIHHVIEEFPHAKYAVRCGNIKIILHLKPTMNSPEYTVRLEAKLGRKLVKVFIINPEISKEENEKHVPHLYKDGSLCLYYPKYYEWDYRKPWTETLIPWTSLWLFYYEIWKETGEWRGGGIHSKGSYV